jgi:Cu2+-containing amine oxidase
MNSPKKKEIFAWKCVAIAAVVVVAEKVAKAVVAVAAEDKVVELVLSMMDALIKTKQKKKKMKMMVVVQVLG